LIKAHLSIQTVGNTQRVIISLIQVKCVTANLKVTIVRTTKCEKGNAEMDKIKIIIHIETEDDIIGIKEDFTAYCERFADVKWVEVINDGKDEKSE
jgi:hypothetical protein